MATLKNWRVLRKLRYSTARISDLVKAVLVLTSRRQSEVGKVPSDGTDLTPPSPYPRVTLHTGPMGIVPIPKNCTAPVEQRLRAELTKDDFDLAGPEAGA